MEDGGRAYDAAGHATAGVPPPPPEPSAEETTSTRAHTPNEQSDEALQLEHERWDITSISGLAALRMLAHALQVLADAMGDVPPTPPVSRPVTPVADDTKLRRTSSPETSCSMIIGSPEAHPHEPITVTVGADAENTTVQRIAIARRFFSKTAPPFTLIDYLLRLHNFCPHSSGVYLTTAVYCHRLCVADILVPATSRTIHRLALAAIRIAAKAVEDNKWTQERYAKVGGVSRVQLMNLEVSLCFLLDFELGVDREMLAQKMFLLQEAGRQGLSTRTRLSDDFRLKLPARIRKMTFGR
ncbi:hypothetical protein LTR62_003038 [Meristemomyces frigidus]|uniref:Cyclin-domain-containing protein n=1 Tax=Meristemomyces frigidus TaxID=1508187 RepID=A0AAN7TS70_9PEZI|nr:hypothetical protein LTR62_003038 [Meristemomyces frigidus]